MTNISWAWLSFIGSILWINLKFYWINWWFNLPNNLTLYVWQYRCWVICRSYRLCVKSDCSESDQLSENFGVRKLSKNYTVMYNLLHIIFCKWEISFSWSSIIPSRLSSVGETSGHRTASTEEVLIEIAQTEAAQTEAT